MFLLFPLNVYLGTALCLPITLKTPKMKQVLPIRYQKFLVYLQKIVYSEELGLD